MRSVLLATLVLTLFSPGCSDLIKDRSAKQQEDPSLEAKDEALGVHFCPAPRGVQLKETSACRRRQFFRLDARSAHKGRVPGPFALFANEWGCHNLTEVEVTVKLELLWLL